MAEIPSFWEVRGAVPPTGAAPASAVMTGAAPASAVMTEAEIAAAKARIARLAPYGASGAVPAAAPVAAPATNMTGRLAAKIPTLIRGAGAVGKGIGAVAPWAAPVLATGMEGMGVADVAANPNATKADVATRVAEGVGRLGGMGAGAGLGLAAGGPVGAAIGGTVGYFAPNMVYSARDTLMGRTPTPPPPDVAAPAVPVTPTTAAPAPAPVAPPASSAVTTPALTSAPPAREPAYAGMTAADIHGTAIPPRGTGAILNESTGKVTNIGSRTPDGPGAVPQGFQARAGSLASFFGGAMRQKQAATAEKAAQAAALKLPETMKSAAEATILSERMKLAAAETDPARKAAILAGHVMPEPKLQAPPNMQPLPGDKDQSGVVFDPAKGAFRKVPITQAATTANIDAALAGSMKGKTRAQVIQAYKDKGYDVSGIK